MTPSAFRLGLSGAIPEPEVLRENKTNSADIHQTVRRLVERALARGDRIVYGSHPSFTPIIEDVALRFLRPDLNRRVRMFVARRFFNPAEWDDYFARHARYASIEPIGGFETPRDEALEELRERMVSEFDAMVCIGGKLHWEGTDKPGVLEEFEKAVARQPPIPIYLLGGSGGCTRMLFENRGPNPIPNGLDEPDNNQLGKSALVWEAIELLFKGLAQIRPRPRSPDDREPGTAEVV